MAVVEKDNVDLGAGEACDDILEDTICPKHACCGYLIDSMNVQRVCSKANKDPPEGL